MRVTRSIFYVFIMLLSVSFLSGCALFRTHSEASPRIEVLPNQWVQLPTPAELGLHLNATQILSATYKKESYTSQVQVELSSKHIILVALGGWGGEVFSIDYDGQTIQSSSLPMPNADMGVKHTLTDFIFTYASPERLRYILAPTDIHLSVQDKKRIFSIDGKPVMEIDYESADPWKGKVVIHNIKLGYTINISTVSIKKTPLT
jgi:hypothetical protein